MSRGSPFFLAQKTMEVGDTMSWKSFCASRVPCVLRVFHVLRPFSGVVSRVLACLRIPRVWVCVGLPWLLQEHIALLEEVAVDSIVVGMAVVGNIEVEEVAVHTRLEVVGKQSKLSLDQGPK